MRRARIKGVGSATYHIISRTVAGEYLLTREEKAAICEIMRKVEAFAGVRVLTYAVLTTHIHLVLQVPEREEVQDDTLIRRIGALYGEKDAGKIERKIRRLREKGLDKEAEELKASYTYRMYDLSEFMKTLKQRISQSYNKRHNRKGTIWADRFKSLLIASSAAKGRFNRPLGVVAAYVDLNAVRAGLVEDPARYTFCGYADALSGVDTARKGIVTIVEALTASPQTWSEAQAVYQSMLQTRNECSTLRTRIPQFTQGPTVSEADLACLPCDVALPMAS